MLSEVGCPIRVKFGKDVGLEWLGRADKGDRTSSYKNLQLISGAPFEV
jgi:hypothetical protein